MPKNVEHRTESLPPFDHEIREMSVSVALRKVVEDLFTCKTVADKLQDIEDNPAVEVLVSHHKLTLVEHLEEVVWRGIDEFLVQVDNIQAQPELSLPSSPAVRDDLDSRTD